MVSAAGLGIAILVALWFPDGAFVYLFGISLFGGLYAWLVIFVSHLAFRPQWKAAGGSPLPVKMAFHPWGSLLGAASMLAILATTWWVEGMRVTLLGGLPWLGVLTVGYLLVARRVRLSRSRGIHGIIGL
jgi:L-asparagine transporter-like permease